MILLKFIQKPTISFRLVALLALVIGCACLSPDATAQQKPEEITLVIGQIKSIPLSSKVVRVAIGNGKVISPTILETEMVLLGEVPGNTSMRVWTADGKQSNYEISVMGVDLKRISEMLKSFPSVNLERVGDLVLLTGTASKVDLSRIADIVKLFPSTHNAVREEGVTMRRMVYFKVQIVELKKSLGESIGVKWQNSITGPNAGLAANFQSNPNFRLPDKAPAPFNTEAKISNEGYGWRPFIGLTTSITSMINLAVDSGDAFILASPELSARSGGKAEFLAGGQIPILAAGTANSPPTVTFKDYGIRLSIEPVADEKNNVVAVLKTEVSNVDLSNSVAGNPGFLTRKTDSEFNVQSGQTIVLSGLVNKELAADVSKLAGLGDLPVLGPLFRSKNYRSGRTDLVIFVTPTVIDPSSSINQGQLQKASEIEQKYDSLIGNKEGVNPTSAARGILN